MTITSGTVEVDHAAIALRLLIDVISISIFAIGIYFWRHRRSDLAMVFWFFNMCLFVTVTVIQTTEVAAALGFGLFAILSIIRLRSEPFDNREIGYFFGALVLGLLNGIGTSELWFTLLLNALLLTAIFVLDHPRALPTATRRRIVFDRVETDERQLIELLEQRLGLTVVSVTVSSVDFVRDSMELDIACRAERRSTERPSNTIVTGVPA